MISRISLATICLMALVATATADCTSSKANREIVEGKARYQRAQFDSAIEHFEAAVALDDGCTGARFALAAAYASEVVPGVDTPENQRYADQAISVFRKILERDPHNANALKDIGFVYLYTKRNDRAREYFQSALAANPGDPDLYYLVGVVDWMVAYRDIEKRKREQGLRLNDEFTHNQAGMRLCKAIRSANGPIVDEGLKMLQGAVEKQRDYDDAVAYMSLLNHLKVNMACGEQVQLVMPYLTQEQINRHLAAQQTRNSNSGADRSDRETGDDLETGKVKFLVLPPAPPQPGSESKSR